MTAWILTHAAYVACSYANIIPASIVHDHWGALLVIPNAWTVSITRFQIAANVYGYALTVFAYAKAYLWPSHREDCKFSGSWLYDMFMGIECTIVLKSD